ncbi:hypothetical protein GCM10027217_25520 [Pseudomaricurvus hydrocarbonicus]
MDAIYRLLQQPLQPVCDMYLAIMNISAALTEPFFRYRQLPGKRDLNRCFKAPYDDAEGQLARSLMQLIQTKKPEALIDLHNTSGNGPAFGVAVHLDSRHDALVSLFTERLIITDLQLGALMELSEEAVPTVTVECGGAQEEEAHKIAFDGLQRYFTTSNLFDLSAAPWPIEVLHNPVRLELAADLTFSYAESLQARDDLSLRADIEQFNFGVVTPDTLLGWCTATAATKLHIRNASAADEALQAWFSTDNGELRPIRPLKLFMITARADIARSDCLLYAVRCRE